MQVWALDVGKMQQSVAYLIIPNVVIGFCVGTSAFVSGPHTKFREIQIKDSCLKSNGLDGLFRALV